ncbi:MAG TPA: ankyrin repeat domain-containing protein [Candidatus Babeliales bacterium]|nr:ankyrin repeat domain-containing protein [Candidatus Babeliales bacterium]
MSDVLRLAPPTGIVPRAMPPMGIVPRAMPPMGIPPRAMPPMGFIPRVLPPGEIIRRNQNFQGRIPLVRIPPVEMHLRRIPTTGIITIMPNPYFIGSVYESIPSEDRMIIKIKKFRLIEIMKNGDINALKEIHKSIENFYLEKVYGQELLTLCFEKEYFSRGDPIREMIDNRHVAEFLLQIGEDVNRKINVQNFSHIACKSQNLYFLRFLLKHKADFLRGDTNHNSALEYACMNRWFAGIFLILSEINIERKHKKLFERMCKILTHTNSICENVINKRFSNGETILHLMTKKRNLMAVEILCQYGANPMIKDNNGISPYKLALNNNWNEEFLLLVNAPVKSKREDVDVRKTHKFKWFC